MDGQRVLQNVPPTGTVAIIRALQLGDMLCAVPSFRSVRTALSDAHLTLIGLPWARSFVSRFSTYINDFKEFPGCPGIPECDWNDGRTQAFIQSVSNPPFDLVIQLHGRGEFINSFASSLKATRTAGYCPSINDCPDEQSFLPYPDDRPEIHRHLRLMEFLGAPSQGDHLEFPISDDDRNEFEPIAGRLSANGYVCLHVGSRWPSRRWKPSGYAAVADALAAQGLQIVFTGSSWEAPIVEEVIRGMRSSSLNLVGQTTLGAMACLIQQSRLLISNDTGAAHLAAAVRTPSVVIVLGSDAARWRPLNHLLHRVIRHPVDCAPCENFHCPTEHECSKYLNAQRVIDVAITQLKSTGAIDAESSSVEALNRLEDGQASSTVALQEAESCVDYVF